ncbi:MULTISPECIES: type II toxin-antitoxin system HicB family antitoxin [Acetobacter]|uniref:Putative HicB family RNase H-like nuclease n=1 Tax=Acetobacter lovaniensis TaxID=104100 RepID=A0A841QH96_9PROT|nr:type II toxin-antitoxin system HicB family antitoxin [Acetobacter lovaniensis]MBB6457624.1 putative HicB family RNase H-like nuclease [Acetobacter lovaniensis]MCI1698240.1 type II toxin-antitoxin system HicB family antitoxin [Acetobacter lovaniensis]MCP1240015.1 type II toxin-antitoxin system HicB family antitoxin [Acetobacter lovaniensis]NHN81909.1 toxin-antitoxin system HicB family antitoxin [Acetobacter lovaniensis]GBQ64659.1 toxin-antitoxin systems HicB [Acetobacter lovaniensis NRIC 047
MNNVVEIGGHRAVIPFDPEIGMFRGEFLGLNGGADFYADSVGGLQKEGKASLGMFLEMCAEKGIGPGKHSSGRFVVRLPENVHARAAGIATARGVSLNRLVQDALSQVDF